MTSLELVQPKQWEQCTPPYINKLAVLKFPFVTLPSTYAPAETVLQLEDGACVYAFTWCYLDRRGGGLGTFFNINSLSSERAHALPQTLTRLSKWFRHKNSRPRSVFTSLVFLGQLLKWADQPQQGGRYEAILSDPDVALEALKRYHTYLRGQSRSGELSSQTAGERDRGVIACLSEIHSRVYSDHIQPLESRKGAGTSIPDSAAIAKFGSTLQAIFDSAAALILQGKHSGSSRALRTCASDDTALVELKDWYGPLRLVELACVAYIGLVCMDSGANLAVLAQYEEPEDLHEQLADPNRINLQEKAIKFRAGGKTVEVFLTATTVTRLRTYLELRQALVAALRCADIAPLFIQCNYAETLGEPTAVRALDRMFLQYLRKKTKSIGAPLPAVTLRQLRAYAQQRFVRTAPLPVAAQRMGHSVETAIRAYCRAQEATHRSEIANYLGSLQRTVLDASAGKGDAGRNTIEITPAGACTDYGNPAPATHAPAVEPDCRKVEGCFFCPNYRVHADEEDTCKLMSCRRALSAIAPLQGDSVQTHRVYSAVIDRIDALLGEIRRRQPKAYEAVWAKVEERGELTSYWARKIQQLHLLGMLRSDVSRAI